MTDYDAKAKELTVAWEDSLKTGVHGLDSLASAIASALREAEQRGAENHKAKLEAMTGTRGQVDIPEGKRFCGFCGRDDVALVEGPIACICLDCAENAVAAIDARGGDQLMQLRGKIADMTTELDDKGAEIERLRKALAVFVGAGKNSTYFEDGTVHVIVSVENYNSARAALEGKQHDNDR